MLFRPFGVAPNGEKIRDVSGITVKANVEYLEEVISKKNGGDAGRQAIDRLCDSLNARISDPSYHVTPEFLQNIWHSYSYEFVCYLGEFCILISEDPNFQFEMGKHKFISPVIQTLGRPFSVSQIFELFPRFGEKFAKDSLRFSVRNVTNGSAILGMTLTEHVARQFGSLPQPVRLHHLPGIEGRPPGRAATRSPPGICQRPRSPMYGGWGRVL